MAPVTGGRQPAHLSPPDESGGDLHQDDGEEQLLQGLRQVVLLQVVPGDLLRLMVVGHAPGKSGKQLFDSRLEHDLSLVLRVMDRQHRQDLADHRPILVRDAVVLKDLVNVPCILATRSTPGKIFSLFPCQVPGGHLYRSSSRSAGFRQAWWCMRATASRRGWPSSIAAGGRRTPAIPDGTASRADEAIADAVHGLNEAGIFRVVLELLPQLQDMIIDGPGGGKALV